MINRIVNYFNKHTIASIDDLINAPSVSNQASIFNFKPKPIPRDTVTRYCQLLSNAGFIYCYDGVYMRGQKIPNGYKIDDFGVLEDDMRLLHSFNRLHSIEYPEVDDRIRLGLNVRDNLHLMQFRVDSTFHIYDLMDYTERNVYYLIPIVKALVNFGYLENIEHNTFKFTDKYIPFSIDFKTLVHYNSGVLSKEEMDNISLQIAEELKVLDITEIGVVKHKDWKLDVLKQIEWVKSLVNSFDYLNDKERYKFTDVFYKSIHVFDKYIGK